MREPEQGVKASLGLCSERLKTRMSSPGALHLSCRQRATDGISIVGPLYLWVLHLHIYPTSD